MSCSTPFCPAHPGRLPDWMFRAYNRNKGRLSAVRGFPRVCGGPCRHLRGRPRRSDRGRDAPLHGIGLTTGLGSGAGARTRALACARRAGCGLLPPSCGPFPRRARLLLHGLGPDAVVSGLSLCTMPSDARTSGLSQRPSRRPGAVLSCGSPAFLAFPSKPPGKRIARRRQGAIPLPPSSPSFIPGPLSPLSGSFIPGV